MIAGAHPSLAGLSPAVAAVLAAFSSRVRQFLGPRALLLKLFGSYARGEAHEESDVDVLVVVPNLLPAEKRTILDFAGEFLKDGYMVSALVMDAALYDKWMRQERPLVMEIQKDGRVL